MAGGSASSPIFSAVSQTGPETAKIEWWKTSDGVEHCVRNWAAATGAGPVCIYLHGIEGHGRWFEETAIKLAAQGISTYAPDRRGAGASRERRGHIEDYRRLVLDVEELIQLIRQRHPASAMFIIANCWGGKVGLVAAQNCPELKGIVLTSPAVSVQVDVSLVTKLLIGLNYCFSGGNAYFDIPLTARHFTDNPPYLEYIARDPQRLTQATAAFFVQSLKLTRACKTAATQLRLPVLILQSGRDQIVNLKSIGSWFDSLVSADKTLKIFTSAAHSLDFELHAEEYQSLLGEWILARA
jgi:acylglycerol lipase